LRNDVDKELISELRSYRYQNDEKAKTELNQIWQMVTEKINSFEQQYTNSDIN
jgi:hypothetical protein